MTDLIIVPRAPTAEQIRYAANRLYNREPTENEFAILHQVYQDMTHTGIPLEVDESAPPQTGAVLNWDPDSLLNQASE